MKHIAYIILFLLTTLSGFAQNDYVTNADLYTGTAEVTATQQVKLQPGFHAASGSNVWVHISTSASYPDHEYTEVPGSTPGTITPDSDKNYIREFLLREANTGTSVQSDERVETIQYFDGIGRLSQTVTLEGSPLNHDIIVPVTYDDFGRVTGKYLPFAMVNFFVISKGGFVDNADAECISYYQSNITGRPADDYPFTTIDYEDSPMNRVLGEKGVGNAWQSNPTIINYLTNSDSINSWDETGAGVTYDENELYITYYEDEDHHKSREYKDKLGQVVLKEAWDGIQWLQTYYIYDDFGLLRTVVPPEATNPSDESYCYYYTYDKRKRMVVKELPGAEPVYMVYDDRDRLVMTQDGELRNDGLWLATIYDELNRLVLTALVNNSGDRSTVQSTFGSSAINATFSTSGAIFGYNVSMPTNFNVTEANTQTVTWYDNHYSFLASEFGSEYSYASPHLANNPTSFSTLVKGFTTGTLTRVIDDAITDQGGDNLLLTVMYYDEYGQVIRIISDNHLGGKDIVYNDYNFAGQLEETVLRHNASGSSEDVKLTTSYDYNHQGLMLAEYVQVDDDDEITIAAYEYNEIGDLVAKYYHGNSTLHYFNQVADYTYNSKGWLSKINTPVTLGDDLFALNIKYNDRDVSNGFDAYDLYNGNISEIMWQNAGSDLKGYGFMYDGVNRLIRADYGSGSAFSDNGNDYDTEYEYDKNGNIKNLSRYMDNNHIDQLTYTYNGNQLTSVTDNGDTYYKDQGYKAVSGTYLYDDNGNMRSDPSKGTSIEYNYLNLPQDVNFGGDNHIEYVYAADGTKLRKEVSGTNAENAKALDYIGSFLYENNELKCIFTSEGRIVRFNMDGTISYKYEYNLKDHLGNTRVAFAGHSNGQPEVMQVNDYYPFGLLMEQQNHFAETEIENKYLYNGKEWQNDELAGENLGWYDYGARMYDAALGRFMVQDRYAEKYFDFSPYQYAANNPICNIDVNGDSIFLFYNNHRYLYDNGTLSTYSGLDDSGNPTYTAYTAQAGSWLEGMNNALTELQNNTKPGGDIVNYFSGSTHAYLSGKNQGSYIDLNLTSTPINIDSNLKGSNMPTEKGVQQSPLWLDVGHELAHRRDVLDNGLTQAKNPWITINGVVKAKDTEKYATHVENKMRYEYGLPLRTHYIVNVSTNSGYEPSRIVDKFGNSVFGYGNYKLGTAK